MNNLIGKSTELVEKENNFLWYVEFKPKSLFGFDLEEHDKLMGVFAQFLPNDNINILKLNEEHVEEVFTLGREDALKNIKLLGVDEGKLYDDGDEVSYSILTDNFLAIILKGMIFWSSNKEQAFKWAQTLKDNELDFFKPDFIGDIEDAGDKENSLWEDKTKVNGVWIDDKTGGVVGDKNNE